MRNKIYIVHENVGVMGEIQERMIRAFACKRTAKKFIDYKNLKLTELKKKFNNFNPEFGEKRVSKASEYKLRRFMEIFNTNEYSLKEIDLHH